LRYYKNKREYRKSENIQEDKKVTTSSKEDFSVILEIGL